MEYCYNVDIFSRISKNTLHKGDGMNRYKRVCLLFQHRVPLFQKTSNGTLFALFLYLVMIFFGYTKTI